MKGKNGFHPILATEVKDRWKSDAHMRQRKFMLDGKTD